MFGKGSRAAAAAMVAVLVAAGCGGGTTAVRGTAVAPRDRTQVVQPYENGMVPPGTTLWLSLDESIDGRHARIGDPFEAHVDQPVVSPDGEVLIPQGARVRGHIVDLRAEASHGEPAMVALALDSIDLGGERVPLEATIIETEVPGVTRRTVRGRDVAVGAAAGLILGGILEGWEGALVGGLLGAGAGTAISLGTSDVEPRLPRGTNLAIRIERPTDSLASLGLRRVY